MAKSSESSSSNANRNKTPKLGADLCLSQPANWSHICPHCGRAFPSCHALGGHQNAHRLLKKEAAARRLCPARFGYGYAFIRNAHILSSPPPPAGIMIPNTDLQLAPPEPTLVKPIPIRICADGVSFGVVENNGMEVEPELKPPSPVVEMKFIPEVAMTAPAAEDEDEDDDGKTVSDEGSASDANSIEVDSNWELDLDLKL